MLLMMIIREAQRIVPGPANMSPSVPPTARTVATASHRFLVAVASATVPMTGMRSMLAALLIAMTTVQRKVAEGASPATTLTKYALKTAVSTTVV